MKGEQVQAGDTTSRVVDELLDPQQRQVDPLEREAIFLAAKRTMQSLRRCVAEPLEKEAHGEYQWHPGRMVALSQVSLEPNPDPGQRRRAERKWGESWKTWIYGEAPFGQYGPDALQWARKEKCRLLVDLWTHWLEATHSAGQLDEVEAALKDKSPSDSMQAARMPSRNGGVSAQLVVIRLARTVFLELLGAVRKGGAHIEQTQGEVRDALGRAAEAHPVVPDGLGWILHTILDEYRARQKASPHSSQEVANGVTTGSPPVADKPAMWRLTYEPAKSRTTKATLSLSGKEPVEFRGQVRSGILILVLTRAQEFVPLADFHREALRLGITGASDSETVARQLREIRRALPMELRRWWRTSGDGVAWDGAHLIDPEASKTAALALEAAEVASGRGV